MLNELLEAAMASDVSGKDQVRICMESFVEAVAAERDSATTLCSTAAVVDGIKEAATGNPEVAEAAEELFRQVALANGVSTEGLISDLIAKFRKITSKKKPGLSVTDENRNVIGYKKHRDAALQAIDKFYLNDKWLSQQEFVVGDISIKGMTSTLSVDGEVLDNPLETIELGYNNIEKFIDAWVPKLEATYDAYNAIDEKLSKDIAALKIDADKLEDTPWEDRNVEEGEKVTALLKEAIKKQLAIKNPATSIPTMAGTGFGNMVITGDTWDRSGSKVPVLKSEVRGKRATTETVRALNKEQIKTAATWMKKLLIGDGIMDRVWQGWGDHSDGSDLNTIIYCYDNALYMDYYDIWYHQSADDMWAYPVWDLADYYKIASCLERLISRSIK